MSSGRWVFIPDNSDPGGCIIVLIIMIASGVFGRCGCSGCTSCESDHTSTRTGRVLQQSVIGHATVIAKMANVRTGPGTNYSIYTTSLGENLQLSRNSQIDIIEDAGEWYKINTSDGGTGYIKKTLCANSDLKEDFSASSGNSYQERTEPQVDINRVYYGVDEPATWADGEDALLQFYEEHKRYPPVAQRKGITSGHAKIEFLVERDGRVTTCKYVDVDNGGFGQEAIRLIKAAAPYVPAKVNGVAVRSYKEVDMFFVDENVYI